MAARRSARAVRAWAVRGRRAGPLLLLLGLTQAAACERPAGTLLLATTTSLDDTGLLDSLLLAYQAAEGPRVRVLVVGSGEALELGRRGDVDVILAHSPEDERRFMSEGHGTLRAPVFATDFVLVGPAMDPAGARTATSALEALDAIARSGAPFVSRGDRSGTHRREEALWAEAAGAVLPGRPPAPRYVAAGLGMAETLRLADERRAYTLSDRATFSLLSGGLDLIIVFEDAASLLNVYSVIVVRDAANEAAAHAFAGWLRSGAARERLAAVQSGGSALFRAAPD